MLILGDCLQEMKTIPDGSVDLVLTDLPYGVTNAEWDVPLPLCDLWEEWHRVLRPYGCVVLFGTQPFVTDLIQSNRREFSHVWYWKKNNITGNLNAHREPMRRIEEVAVFICNVPSQDNTGHYANGRKYMQEERAKTGLSAKQIRELLGSFMASHYFTDGQQFSYPTPEAYAKLQTTGCFSLSLDEVKALDEDPREKYRAVYNPQGIKPLSKNLHRKNNGGQLYRSHERNYVQTHSGYPDHLIEFDTEVTRYHPTQKPVSLCEYLVKTYTDKGMTVLDCCMGSGSTGLACKSTGRKFIGIEKDPGYFETARSRIEGGGQQMITDRQAKTFYNSAEWKHKREEVLELDRHECQSCKARGLYTPAQTVHHVHHLKDRWDLRLSIYDKDGSRQLVSLCNNCHNAEHPEKAFKDKARRKPLTPERW